jgi:ankyrin repeat protein
MLHICSITYGMDEGEQMPLLHFAAAENDIASLELFLTHQNINLQNNYLRTPLHTASAMGHVNTVKFLLHKEADPNIADCDGYFPLHFAVQKDNPDIVKELLSHGAHINVQCFQHGKTPLHYAVDVKNTPMITTLLQHGANPTIQNHEQLTALAESFFCKFTYDLDPILVTQMVNATDDNKNTQLHLYTTTRIFGNDYYLEFLIQHDASIWSRNEDKKTALNLACDEYYHTLKEYMRKRRDPLKTIYEAQEQVMHMFLRVASKHLSCATFKEMFTQFALLSEIQKQIMRYYYKLNIETIIARKYKRYNKDVYYAKHIEQKNRVKQQLTDNPEFPFLLWRDAKAEEVSEIYKKL